MSKMKQCECCGHNKLKTKFSCIGKIEDCPNCGSSFDSYYYKNGEPLTIPKHWGKCIAVMTEQHQWETFNQSSEDKEVDQVGFLQNYQYYIFIAEDGTLRRARIESSWDPPIIQPKGTRKKLTSYHCWIVDILLAKE
jgi:hypothetical protein